MDSDSSAGAGSVHEGSYLSKGGTSADTDAQVIEWDASVAQLLYDSNADGVVIISEQYIIKTLNSSAQSMFGYFPKEVAGSHIEVLMSKHYRKQFRTVMTDITETTRPGDLEEVREGYCERKAGDTFIATFRIVNNLNSASSDPGFIISIHDESEIMNLQARTQRRLQEMKQQVEAKEAMLLKAQTVEEHALLQAQELRDAQMREKKAKKKNSRNELKEMNDMKLRMIEKHEEDIEELRVKDELLKEQIEAAKISKNDKLIHKLELERLNLLFNREAGDLLLRQNTQSEQVKMNHTRTATDKEKKQLKEAQQLKLSTLREAQTLRRFRKEQRSITKSQKMRQMSQLRETQIEELEALKRKHRQELFTLSNDMKKATRKQKYDQESLAADLLEQQTKFSAEVQLAQQKDALAFTKAADEEAQIIQEEQKAAANLLKTNQDEILQMMASRHADEHQRFGEQLEEKKHYELLAQNCSDMISLHNVDTLTCRYVSPSCEALLGYSQGEMEHINYNDLVHVDNRSEAREAVRRLLEVARGGAKELPSCQQVFRMRRRDGANVWVERAIKLFRTNPKILQQLTNGTNGPDVIASVVSQSPSLEDASHEDMELLFTTRNITQRKDMEEQQRRAEKLQAAATSAAVVKRDFLAFIGHECRNPLNALFNVTDFLDDTGLDDQQSRYLGIIKQCSGDMLRILNDLLDLSKIEAGKIDIEILPFNIRETIVNAVNTMQAQAAKKDLTITYKVEANVPKNLMGDATRIRQILLNMISNGIKFTEKGKVHVALSVHDEIEDNVFVQFKIIDTGVGIDEEVVTKLFTMYGQASVSDYRKYGGSGIGLRLCALLVQQSMGGNIGIESVKGEGTTVWFTVPFSSRITGLGSSPLASSSPVVSSIAIGQDGANIMDHQSTSQTSSSSQQPASPQTLTATALRDHNLLQEQEDRSAEHDLERASSLSDRTPHFVDPEVYEQWASPIPTAKLRRASDGGLSLPSPVPLTDFQQHPQVLQSRPSRLMEQPTKPQHSALPPAQSTSSILPQPEQLQISQPLVIPPPLSQGGLQPRSTPRPTTPTPMLPIVSQPETSQSPGKKPMTVLVVDDIPLNRDIAVALLAKESCKCDTAVDGLEAVNAVKQKVYDLILLDIQMPRMDGMEAIYYIREFEKAESQRRVPVVAISGSVQQAERDSYFQAGMDGFLAKPFKRDEFVKIINKYRVGLPRESAPTTSMPRQTSPVGSNSTPAAPQSAPSMRTTPPPQPRMFSPLQFPIEAELSESPLRTPYSMAEHTDGSTTTPSTRPYPHTPSQTNDTSTNLSHSVRSSSPAVVTFNVPDTQVAHTSPQFPPPQSPPVSEYASQEFRTGENSNVRILVADNSLADRKIYERMLSQYQTDTVGSGSAALDLFDTNTYDVILLDCNLEDMEIQEIVSQIRRKEQLSNQHVPIILVCTTAKQEEELRGVGFSQILIKGRGFINRDILLQALLRSVNIIPGGASLPIAPKDIVDTSELVDSLFLSQISRSSFFAELFQLFVGCTEKIVVNMNKYLREQDPRGLVIEAHNCSSISANIGAVWLSRLATELRVAASKVQGKDLPPDISDLVERVVHGVDLTLEYLEKCHIIARSGNGKWIMNKIPSALTKSVDIIKSDGSEMVPTRVLVVDDMPMTQFIVTTLLSRLQFSCTLLSNGLEAVEELQKNSYDLVLMDNYMNHMTGLDAVAKIRENEKGQDKRTPVIGLTSLVGDDKDEVVSQLIKAGMDDVIFKPVLRNSFLSRLEIWRPKLTDAFAWTHIVDNALLDELALSAPSTISEAIPRIIELSKRVSSLTVNAFGDQQTAQLTPPVNELIELCSMLGASRLAEVAKILLQYISTRGVSESTAHRLVQLYAIVRASTVDNLNKYTKSRPSSPDGVPPHHLVASPSLSSSSSSSLSSRIHVLVADDQALTRMVIQSMISKAFPQAIVHMAENGEVAVAKAETMRYNLILMDIGMPKMDGCKASHLIRKSEAARRAQPTSIIAVTAGSAAKANDATAYQEAGMNELIHKPFTNAKLRLIFDKYIFEKDKPLKAPVPAVKERRASLALGYPDEMVLSSEIMDMLRGLGILDRTIDTFEKHSQEIIHRTRQMDTVSLQKRSLIRQSIHALKGISLNSGASLLGRVCDDLEKIVLDCDEETIFNMLDTIEAEAARAIRRFKEVR